VDIRTNIADAIKYIQRERGLSLSELSEELDIPLSSLKSYAAGAANLRADTIDFLADRFGVTTAELVAPCSAQWARAQIALRAAKELGGLPPERREEAVGLLLKLISLFAPEDAGHE